MINVAILGLGSIAFRVAKGIIYAKNANLYAVASRSFDKAIAFKEKFKADVAYGSYDELYKDSKVDLIYICTPNDTHKDYITACLNAKKHVICEKPMVKNIEDLDEVFSLAKEKNCFLMEAHKTAFTPLNTYIKQEISTGKWGKLLSIQAEYSSLISDSIHDYKGDFMGASYDIGVYPACFANFYAQSNVQQVMKKMYHLGYDVDYGFMAMVSYKNGMVGQINTSWSYLPENKGKALLFLEKAVIEIPAFWKSDVAYVIHGQDKEVIKVNMDSDFTKEVEEAVFCIEHGQLQSEIMGYEQSKEILKIIIEDK